MEPCACTGVRCDHPIGCRGLIGDKLPALAPAYEFPNPVEGREPAVYHLCSLCLEKRDRILRQPRRPKGLAD